MVAEREQLTSLRKPPEGWFWSPEARARRQGVDAYKSLAKTSPDGPRADAEPTVSLPTFRADDRKLPRACVFCRSRLLDRQPPLAGDRRGMLSCTGCGRQLAWLAPALRTLPSTQSVVSGPIAFTPMAKLGAMARPILAGCFERRPGCASRCTEQYGHDADAHEQFGRQAVLIELEQRRGGIVQTGPLAIDFERMIVLIEANDARLSPTEYAIAAHLARHLGVRRANREITEAVWGTVTADVWEASPRQHGAFHTLRVHIARLRAKLGPAAPLVENLPGFGYRLRAEPPTDGAS